MEKALGFPVPSRKLHAMTESLLVQALNRQPVPRPPLWLMRQAGRYLPEYRTVRARFPDFMQFCLTPDAATEVTLQPVHRFGLDAAIIFADILTIPHALGHPVTFSAGHGPRVTPLTTPQQVQALAARLDEIPRSLAPVAATVRQTRAALPGETAVIGFCGGPFTLACYMLDEKPAQGIPNTLAFASQHPEAFAALLHTLTEACARYLSLQIAAGADAVQVFESWAIACPPALWQQAVHTPLTELARKVRTAHPHTPVILFPRGANQPQLQALAASGVAQGLSLSTEVPLGWAHQSLQPHIAIQGNLDPVLMTGPAAPMLAVAQAMLQTAATAPGYIANLGHGLTPDTDPDNLQCLADLVRNWQPTR